MSTPIRCFHKLYGLLNTCSDVLTSAVEWSNNSCSQQWRVPEKLALRFCDMTQSQLKKLIGERRDEVDVKVWRIQLGVLLSD